MKIEGWGQTKAGEKEDEDDDDDDDDDDDGDDDDDDDDGDDDDDDDFDDECPAHSAVVARHGRKYAWAIINVVLR